MTTSTSELAAVQNLYVLQVELWDIIDGDLNDPEQRKLARQRMREFQTLMKKVDQRYMGGEDVYATLIAMQKEVNRKIGSKPSAKKTKAAKPIRKSQGKKPTAKKPAKKTKKVVAKKKPTKKSAKKKATKKKR